MGAQVSRTDFEWVYTQEPHATRRKEILAKHPEVKTLMGHDPSLKWKVLSMVAFQILSAYFLRDASWVTIVILAYVLGGTINHSMTLAIHEISHNLAFGHIWPMGNRIIGMIGNLPLILPMSISFKKYHLEHHKFQGDTDIDMDIPSDFEGKYFRTTFMKFIWVICQPFFYTLRPLFKNPKPVLQLEIMNSIIQFTFDGLLWYFFGFKALMYLLIGTFLAMGLHPTAGHFISEHYMFIKGHETYSYYGPLNSIVFNVGYHNEHHDFPNVPGCNLPKLKAMAPEFYDDLPCHTSWVKVIWDFITDPEVGPYSRVKRSGGKVDATPKRD
ncbi:unnamed protein product [Owenia fusiformis]|uniref:sphingolipid 4-desaturase n=1 Tax=Owenia fusiformis TaxID=6347 RepID=A0A8J1XVL7_OWEFU|nr:unnamed protein product [Owenia fusiformis]